MPLIEGKCPNCGGLLQLKDDKKGGTCPFCGTSYLPQDITNYNTYKINNATLNVDPTAALSQKLSNAETHLSKFKDYDKAIVLFKEITELKADDYRGWWGLVRAHTHEFTKADIGSQTLYKINTYVKYAKNVADDNTREEIENQWQSYLEQNNEWFNQNSATLHTLEERLSDIDKKKNSIVSEINSLKSQIGTYNAQLVMARKVYPNLYTIGLGFIVLIFFFLFKFPVLLLISLAFFAVNVGFLIRSFVLDGKISSISESISPKEKDLAKLSKQSEELNGQIRILKNTLSE